MSHESAHTACNSVNRSDTTKQQQQPMNMYVSGEYMQHSITRANQQTNK